MRTCKALCQEYKVRGTAIFAIEPGETEVEFNEDNCVRIRSGSGEVTLDLGVALVIAKLMETRGQAEELKHI